MSDELQAALARAEEAERQRAFIATTACEDMKRQRDEAFTAGAEAMREACAKVANDHIKCDYPDCEECGTAASIRTFIRALPIPEQEVK